MLPFRLSDFTTSRARPDPVSRHPETWQCGCSHTIFQPANRPFADAAIDALANMIEGKAVRCVGQEIDQYGRLIAKCSTIGFPDIGARLVATGLAWAFIKYSTDYSGLEIAPRARKIGIWQSKTQPPWEYRARRWETAARIIPSGCPIKGNINAKGEKIYHAPWSRHYAKTKVDPSKGERGFAVRPRRRQPDGGHRTNRQQ